MIKSFVLIILIFIPLRVFSVDIDTITKKIIVLNDGYDRVSAIKTDNGIIVIDTHMSTAKMREMKSHIVDFFNDSAFAYIINTHECPEHILGNSIFPNVPKIAHGNFADKFSKTQENGQTPFDSRIKKLEEEITNETDSLKIEELQNKLIFYRTMRVDYLKAAIPPDLSFSDNLTLNMSDLTIEMTYIGKGAHGDCCIFIHIPEEKTLFTGSALTKPPIIHKVSNWVTDIDIERWINVIDTYLQTNDSLNIVPSHELYYSKQDLQEFRDYYDLLNSTIKKHKKSGELDKNKMTELQYNLIVEKFDFFTNEEKSRKRHNENVSILWDYIK